MPAFEEGAWSVLGTAPLTDCLCGVDEVNEIEVTVDGIYLCNSTRDFGEDGRRSVEVVRIQDSDDVACGALDSFVHRIVEAIVFASVPSETTVESGDVGVDDLFGGVGRASVNNIYLVIRPCL